MGDDALLNEIRRMRIVLATQAGIRVSGPMNGMQWQR